MNLTQLQTFAALLDSFHASVQELSAAKNALCEDAQKTQQQQRSNLDTAAKQLEAEYAEEERRRKGWAEQYTSQAEYWLETLHDPLWQSVKETCFLQCVSHRSQLLKMGEVQLHAFLQERQNKMEQVIKRLKESFIPPSMSAAVGRVVPGYRRKEYRALAQHYSDILCAGKILATCDHLDRARAAAAVGKAKKQQESDFLCDEQMKRVSLQYEQERTALQESFAAALEKMDADGLFSAAFPFHPGVYYQPNPLPGTPLPDPLQETDHGIFLHFPLAEDLPASSALLLTDKDTSLNRIFASYGLDVLSASPRSRAFFIDGEGLGGHYALLAPLLETGRLQVWSSEEEIRSGLEMLSRRIARHHAAEAESDDPWFLFVEHLDQNIPSVHLERFFRIVKSGADAGVIVLCSMEEDVVPDRLLEEQFQRLEEIPILSLQENCCAMGNGGVLLCPHDDLPARVSEIVQADLQRRTRSAILPLGPRLPADNWQQKSSANGIEIAVGDDPNGQPVFLRLNEERPYVLTIGDVDVGKSSLYHTICLQLMANYSPDEVRLAFGDFKMGAEFNTYAAANLPSVEAVVTDEDPDVMASFLRCYVNEMLRRQQTFARLEQISGTLVRKYETYRAVWARYDRPTEVMPRLVLLIDEFQSLFDSGTVTAQLLSTLVRKGRTYGIHIVMASQRAVGDDPHNSFTPSLKNYFTSRFVLRVPQAAARTVLSERCADTGRENSGIAAAPALAKGHAVFNTYMGELESANQSVQCYYPDDQTIRTACRILSLLNGQGSSVLLKQDAPSPEQVLSPDDLLLLGASVCLHRDCAATHADTIVDDSYVGIRTGERGQNLLLTGSDLRMAHSVLRSAAVYLLSRKPEACVHVFGLPDAPLTRELLQAADPAYTFHTTPEDMLAELNRQLEEPAAAVNLFVEPDTIPAFAQSLSGIRTTPEAAALKAVLEGAQAGGTFNLLYAKTFRNLRSQMPYAAVPVRLSAVGDAENLRAAMPETYRAVPSEFDLLRKNAICAYYCNAESGKWGKVRLFAL